MNENVEIFKTNTYKNLYKAIDFSNQKMIEWMEGDDLLECAAFLKRLRADIELHQDLREKED